MPRAGRLVAVVCACALSAALGVALGLWVLSGAASALRSLERDYRRARSERMAAEQEPLWRKYHDAPPETWEPADQAIYRQWGEAEHTRWRARLEALRAARSRRPPPEEQPDPRR